MAGTSQARFRVRWIHSGIAFNRKQKEVIRSLGLRRLHQVVERDDTPVVRGLIAKVAHLVEVLEPAAPARAARVPEYTIFPASARPEAAEAAREEAAEAAPAPEPAVGEPAAEVARASVSPAAVEETGPARKRSNRRKPTAQTATQEPGAGSEPSGETES